MASVVCQGLQTCLEPPVIESGALTHKLSSNPTQVLQKPKLEANSNNGESVNKNNGFSFLNVLANPSPPSVVKNEEVYVHPMVKRATSALSAVSLEMCTESLGAETGSDVSDSSDEFTLEDRERLRSLQRSKARFDLKMVSHRKSGGGGGCFPPPLTSISGSDGTVKVNPHREGGRLVIKAVSVSDCGAKFETERANGRLKLSFFKDCFVNVETGRAEMKNQDREEECCDGDVVVGEGCQCSETDRKVGGRTVAHSLKRLPRLPNSFDEPIEFGLTKCNYGGNRDKVMGNWSLFRVVIS